jgi:hypothetical protein
MEGVRIRVKNEGDVFFEDGFVSGPIFERLHSYSVGS